jgi:hypothetical protein
VEAGMKEVFVGIGVMALGVITTFAGIYAVLWAPWWAKALFLAIAGFRLLKSIEWEVEKNEKTSR